MGSKKITNKPQSQSLGRELNTVPADTDIRLHRFCVFEWEQHLIWGLAFMCGNTYIYKRYPLSATVISSTQYGVLCLSVLTDVLKTFKCVRSFLL